MLFFRPFNPYKPSISPLAMKLNQNFQKMKLRKQITWRLKVKNNSNYSRQHNFLRVMHKTKLQNINKSIKRWKTETWPNIWLLLRDEVLPVRLQEPVDQCLLCYYLLVCKISIGLWSPYSVIHTGIYNESPVSISKIVKMLEESSINWIWQLLTL